MVSRFRRDLDPLDLEVVERAFEVVSDAIKIKSPSDLDSDEALEAALRQELLEMVCFSGVSDPDALRDVLIVDMINRWDSVDLRGRAAGDRPVAVGSVASASSSELAET